MVLLDTSFLYAYFDNSDSNHEKVIDQLDYLDRHVALIPIEVVQELLTVLTYKASSETAINVVQTLFDKKFPLQILYSDEDLFTKTFTLFKKIQTHTLSYTDCLLITLAKDLGMELFSFDKQLLRTAKLVSMSA